MNGLKKLDKWITNCYNNKGWMGIIFKLLLLSLFYAFFFWEVPMNIWLGIHSPDPLKHHWHMMIANGMVAVGIFAAAVRAIQLIKHQDWFTQRRQNKRRADDTLTLRF